MFSQFTRPTLSILRSDTAESRLEYQTLIPEPKTKLSKFVKSRLDIPALPNEFEGRKIWKKYLSEILDQKECGACWAFAAASSLSDRFNIQSLGGFHITLSPARIVFCDPQGSDYIPNIRAVEGSEAFKKFYKQITDQYGCGGNTLSEAWRYLYVSGTNTIQCFPINELENTEQKTCSDIIGHIYSECVDHTPARFYNADHIYAIPGTQTDGGSELEIRQEIYKWGPVSTAFEVYPDFYTFDPLVEIYEWNGQGERLGGHSVVIDGWGEENGIRFWWVRNSWGKDWGIQGYFKMIRGTNNCKFEENVITGSPNIQFGPLGYGLRDWQERFIDTQHKARVHDVYWFGGGIDPLTGYVRRHLVRDEEIKNLDFLNFPALSPDFVAGQIQLFESMVESNKNNNTRSIIIYMIIFVLLIIGVIVVFIL
jgi:cathepsin B